MYRTAEEFKGKILHTLVQPNLCKLSKSERMHLAKMNSGEFALVRSWLLDDKRIYCVHSRIGSHITIEQALIRFDFWYEDEK